MGNDTTSPFNALSKHEIGPKKRDKSTGAGRFIPLPPSYPYSISRLSTFDE